MKVSKEFILEAHKAACSEWKTRIENELPKLFKDKLEVGKWYNYGEIYLVCFTDLSDTHYAKGYGFHNGEYKDFESFGGVGGFFRARPATEEEVKQALIAEAKKRGVKEGIRVCSANGRQWNIESNFISFYFDENKLFIDNVCIFNNGKWAEIIPKAKELTVAEIEKQLGYKIKIVK